MISDHNEIIPPEAVASKLAAWRNFKTPKFADQVRLYPRLPQLAWFIQSASMQPGGLKKFADDFLDAMPSRIGTPTMVRLGKTTEPYTPTERETIYGEIPRWGEFSEDVDGVAQEFWSELGPIGYTLAGRPTSQHRKLNHAHFYGFCQKAVRNLLASHLRKFCTAGNEPLAPHEHDSEEKYEKRLRKLDQVLEGVWYIAELQTALIEYMDLHAAKVRRSIAMTEVTKQCVEAIEYARQERAMVLIEGDTRFGKTQSVNNVAEAEPGLFRLVRTPCGNSDFDLMEAFAESLGIEVALKTKLRELRAKVEFIIRHSGLMFIIDEAHFLLPARYSKLTPPMRLNWVRTRIVDLECPLVLVTTPQDFHDGVRRFTHATGHNIAQFLGRALLTVKLPTVIEDVDLMAVAKIHFPDLDDDFLDIIISAAEKSPAYLMTMEAIARRARFFARRAGRGQLLMADVDTAISEIAPQSLPQVAPGVPIEKVKAPRAIKRGRNTASLQHHRTEAPPLVQNLEIPQRDTTLEIQPA